MAEKGRTWTERETRLLLQIWSEDRIQRQLQGAVRDNAVCQTIADTAALNSASWLAVRVLLAKMLLLLLLLIRIRRRCLSHTIDKRPKQRNNTIIAVAYQLFVYILHPGCDIINHKNATARVNVNGSIRVKPGFKPGLEPGSRCPCERGVCNLHWWCFSCHQLVQRPNSQWALPAICTGVFPCTN